MSHSRENRRCIVHVDMDAFFASIEQRDDPGLRGKPVVVGADPKGGKGRGVVSTCSYEARRFGIRSAMPISIAYRKCPTAFFLPVNMERYADVSAEIYEILYSFTPDIETVSIDEAFLDITGSWRLFGSPLATCRSIKSKIYERIGLTASIGFAPTMMAAKIASGLKKPNGLVEVTEEGLLNFLWPLEVRRIWGLGEKCEKLLSDMGVRTIGDLAKMGVEELVRRFGKVGLHFWELANGIDERTIDKSSEAKSISSETTFETDTGDSQKIESNLIAICEKVSNRLRRENLKCRTMTLKIRLENFQTFTRSITMTDPTNFTDVLYKTAKELYNNFKGAKLVRLVGVKTSNMSPADSKESLFTDFVDERKERLHSAMDSIKERFGSRAIYRAGGHTI